MRYEFSSKLWQYPGQAAWHFVTLPQDVSDEIRLITADFRRGFGSVRVYVAIHGAQFTTSIFPDSRSGCYMLPVKKSVRVSAGIVAGDTIPVSLTVEI